MVPVNGEGATAAKRPELGADVPVSGPAANTNGWRRMQRRKLRMA